MGVLADTRQSNIKLTRSEKVITVDDDCIQGEALNTVNCESPCRQQW